MLDKFSVCFFGGCVCVAAAAKSLQSCPTLCDPEDGSLPGSPVSRILQARTLEWVAISFSKCVCGVGAKYFKIDVLDSPDHESTDRWSHIKEMDSTNIKGARRR